PRPPEPPPPAPPPGPPDPPPVRPEPPPPSRKLGLWIGIGAATVLLVALAAVFGDREHEPAPVLDGPGGLPAPPSGNGAALPALDQTLAWQDYVLRFSGRVAWNGRGNQANVWASVTDGNTGRPLGEHQLQAAVYPNGNGQWRFATQVPVPGDSRTPGAHVHDINLIFLLRPDGTWVYLKNCWTATNCL
ncbi:MAG: hypothetical protein ABI641_00865, partial [Caldimonas sp.]